jgi:hypothetical protein
MLFLEATGSLPAVGSLLLSSGPSAVPWFVVAVIVGIAIQTLSLRTTTHVEKEIFKLSPSITDSNSSSSISSVARSFSVKASRLHPCPNRILVRSFIMDSSSFAVLDVENSARIPFGHDRLSESDCVKGRSEHVSASAARPIIAEVRKT